MDVDEEFAKLEDHLLNDKKPSLYLRRVADNRWFGETYPFTLLADLKEIEQSPVHHPEGSVWEHTLLVVDLAAQGKHLSDNPRVFMWSALLHDLGKAHTTRIRRGKITAYDHDKHGAILAAGFLMEFTDDEEFVSKVSQMVRWHMQILFVVKKLPWADIDTMISEVAPGEIALLSLCDRLGRGDTSEKTREAELENMKYFIKTCQEHQNAVHSHGSRLLKK